MNAKVSAAEPEGKLVIRTIAMPRDTNANGDIFGGWLVSQMDLGAALIAREQAHSRIVTAAIDQMSFLQPVHIGDVICCYGMLQKIGTSSLQVKVEAWAENQDSGISSKVTEGIFTFVAIDNYGKPIPVVRH